MLDGSTLFIDSQYNKVPYSNNAMMMYHIIWLFMMQDHLALLHKIVSRRWVSGFP